MQIQDEKERPRTISVLAFDRTGLLQRVTEIFSGRGFNIEDLSVGRVVSDRHKEQSGGEQLSRITIVSRCSDEVLENILKQLERPLDVLEVKNLTDDPDKVECDLTLLKVWVSGPAAQADALVIAEKSFRAMCIKHRRSSLTFRFLGQGPASPSFIAAMREFGEVESTYSGTVAIA